MSINGAGGRESYKKITTLELVGVADAFRPGIGGPAGGQTFDEDGFRRMPPNTKGFITTTGSDTFILKFPSGNTLGMSGSVAKTMMPFKCSAIDLTTRAGLLGVKVFPLY
ncbi:MAG TPA: hypothetical protein DCF87_09440 [Opitutae bacterium]|nr:hypothetical protein [Opitutae bacterium]|tara:strand:+ start:5471 stop:5800 length:330 start_codon:yes stop_codon:yes gene_type:complete